MGFNDNIKGNTPGGIFSPTSLQQEAAFYSQLNKMKQAMEKDTSDYSIFLHNKEFEEKKKQAEFYEKSLIAFIDKRHKLEEQYNKKIAKAKLKADADEQKKLQARLDKRLQQEKKNFDKLLKYEEEKRKQSEKAQIKAIGQSMVSDRKSAGAMFLNGKADLRARFSALKDLKDAQGGFAVVDALVGSLGNYVRQLDDQIKNIASYQSKIDTRLQGTNKHWAGEGGLSQTITGVVGISPFLKQQNVVDNLAKLVDRGIAYNVEQRAFLQTISDKIATTFDAANGTLLQLIRVQQADTTAARLGAENALTSFLNSMYQTTEYLSDVSRTVKENIYEAVVQVGGAGGVGLEYQIQKWLGSLYSVGMSSSAIQNIASALGMLGSGNVSGLASNSAMQNLLVMATTRNRGLDYADLLTKGLDESNVNELMKSVVTYLASIANSNKIVQSQYAAIFGMSMSDIVAAQNLLSSVDVITSNSLNYSQAMDQLFYAANTMYERTSIGELMDTAFENVKYSMSAGIASNPALYGIWKAANMLTDLVGGIAIPTISVFGNMVDLNTTVADIMRVGALSGGILSSIGTITSAGSAAGFIPSMMLESMGIQRGQGLAKVTRGVGVRAQHGTSTSYSSAMVGNTSASDIYESSMAGVNQQKESLLVEAKEESTDINIEDINKNVVGIYELLQDVVTGSKSLTIKFNAPSSESWTNPNPAGI